MTKQGAMRMGREKRQTVYLALAKTVGIGVSFGLCLGVQIYLLGVVLGGWLDHKLGSAPWCLVGGVLVAIVFAFRQLFLALAVWQKRNARKQSEE